MVSEKSLSGPVERFRGGSESSEENAAESKRLGSAVQLDILLSESEAVREGSEEWGPEREASERGKSEASERGNPPNKDPPESDPPESDPPEGVPLEEVPQEADPPELGLPEAGNARATPVFPFDLNRLYSPQAATLGKSVPFFSSSSPEKSTETEGPDRSGCSLQEAAPQKKNSRRRLTWNSRSCPQVFPLPSVPVAELDTIRLERGQNKGPKITRGNAMR